MQSKPRVVVISGTVASGKNSILEGVLQHCSQCVRLVTATTRTRRDGEEQGKDYLFFTEEEFLNALDAGEIPEHRFVETGAHYGIYLPHLRELLAQGKTILAQVDIIGARYLKKEFDALTLFIQPHSLEELEKRVRARQIMSDEEWEARKKIATREIQEYMPWYDRVIKNEQGKLDEAIKSVVEILKKEGYIDGHD